MHNFIDPTSEEDSTRIIKQWRDLNETHLREFLLIRTILDTSKAVKHAEKIIRPRTTACLLRGIEPARR